MRAFCRNMLLIVFIAVLSAACSTTRVLQDGEYRLASNKIVVTNGDLSTSQLTPYIKQKTVKWSPFLYVYNWSNGKGKGWDKFVQKIGIAPVVYSSDQVESTEQNIASRLEYLGYYNSRVEGVVRVKKRNVSVTYNVTLGKRYPIRNFTWDVPDGEFRNDFEKEKSSITIKPGDMLSEQSLEEESERLSQAMRNIGYYGFDKSKFYFEADSLARNDSVDLHMSIREYSRGDSPEDAVPLVPYHIQKVSISHPAGMKFREKVLLSFNTIRPGDLYSETTVENTYSRLGALRVFNNVGISMTPTDSAMVRCDIKLGQSKLQGFKVNLEASVNSTGLFGVSPQLNYYHKNIFRGGEWLNLGFMGNFQFKFKEANIRSNEFGVTAGLSFPQFVGLPYRIFTGPVMPRTDVNLSYNYQNRPEYTRHIISGSYGYNLSYKNFYVQAYPLQLNIVRLTNLDPDFYSALANDPYMRNSYSNHFDFGAGANFYYTTNTDSNPQTPFFYTRLNVNHAGNLLSAFNKLMKEDSFGNKTIWNIPYSQYVLAELTVGKTWRFGRDNGQAIATRVLAGAGYAYGNSSSLPFERTFYSGGASSLRGWQARSVGPGFSQLDTTFVIPNQNGDIKLEANLEYRARLFWKIEGAAFLDAGNVWTYRNTTDDAERPSTFSFKSIAMNWGLGLRVNLNFIVLRLDWGMRIHDPARENAWLMPRDWFRKNGYAVHFGVGYPF